MQDRPVHNFRTFHFHCPVVSSDVTFAVNIWRCTLNSEQRSKLEAAIEDALFSELREMNVNFRGLDFGTDVTE